jgi:hypothetical protein
MKRLCCVIVALACLASSGASRAQSAWQDLGTLLRTTCGIAGGTGIPLPGIGSIPIGQIDDLQWMCTISQMYGFVDGAILNGDWEGFATEVAGAWATDLANYMVKQTGVGSLNSWLDTANDAMRGTYRDFRRAITRAVRDAIARQNSDTITVDNPGLGLTTAGGLADEYEKNSAVVRVAGDAVRMSEITERFEQGYRAFKAKKSLEQSQDAIDKSLAPALTKAAQIIGTPITDGEADSYAKKAATANSTREVMVTQVEALSSLMKQQAVFQSAVLNLLAEMAKQGVMTNTTLVARHGEASGAVEATFDGLKAGLEDLAQENLDGARSAAASVQNLEAATGVLYDDTATLDSFDWGAMAP